MIPDYLLSPHELSPPLPQYLSHTPLFPSPPSDDWIAPQEMRSIYFTIKNTKGKQNGGLVMSEAYGALSTGGRAARSARMSC